MRTTREKIQSFQDHPPTWLFKAVVGIALSGGLLLVTAIGREAWNYKLDTQRFVIDSIKRSGTTDQERHMDSLLHVLINLEARRPR